MKRIWLVFTVMSSLFVFTEANNEIHAQRSKYTDKSNDPVQKLGYEKKLRWADKLFSLGSFNNAVEYYQQLLKEQPRNPYLVYQIAEGSWFQRDYKIAATNYEYAYSLAPAIYPEALYKYALMLKMQGRYDEAIEQIERYLEENDRKLDKKTIQRVNTEIKGCEMAKNSMNNPLPATVKNLGENVNTAYTELSPIPLGDTALLFASMNANQLVDVENSRREDYVSRFKVSKKFDSERFDVVDTFQLPLEFNDGEFNDKRYHVGNGSYSPGGDMFFFTKCIEDAKDPKEMNCRIFVSHFEDSKWTKPEELGFGINDKNSSSTHPFMAKIGKNEVLFFSSNRELQSRGGYDIWYSVYDSRQKRYRRPQNAGKQINTQGDEITPYYDEREGKLYFASNGWVGLGGFDIYSAEGGPSRYENLRNLGYPINTSADEMYYVLDPSGKPDAYLVSNREGSIALTNPTCCDDIWRVQFEPSLIVKGKVLNQKNNKKISEVVVKMVNDEGDVKTYNSKDGEFEFLLARNHTYSFSADKQNFYSSEPGSISTIGVKRSDPDEEMTLTIYMDSITIDEEFELNNIYYEFDRANLTDRSIASLENLIKLMKNNPSLDVEINAYTDSRGKDSYNLALSQQRAEAVVDYLVNHGISRSRLSAKGNGASNFVAPNTIDGRDNPEGRAENRRTTFKIINDVPTRRTIYDSSKPGTIGEQREFLDVNEEDAGGGGDDFGYPGSRTNS